MRSDCWKIVPLGQRKEIFLPSLQIWKTCKNVVITISAYLNADLDYDSKAKSKDKQITFTKTSTFTFGCVPWHLEMVRTFPILLQRRMKCGDSVKVFL